MELVTQLANHSSDTFNQTFFLVGLFSVYAYAVYFRFILFIIYTTSAGFFWVFRKASALGKFFCASYLYARSSELFCCQWPNQIDEFVMGLSMHRLNGG